MRAKIAIACMIFLALCSGGVSIFGETTIGPFAVSVDCGKTIAVASPYLVNGFNFNNAMQVFNIKKLVDRLRTRSITFPAGNIGDDTTLTDAEIRFFKQQQEYIGNPFTFIQVRLYGGSAAEAVELMKLVKKHGVRVDVWTIGNEPDLYAEHRFDPSWTPEKYDRLFREYVSAMKAYDPTIRVAGPAVSQPNDEWVSQFIYDCGDIVDVLVWHWYPTDGKWIDEFAMQTAKLSRPMIEQYERWLRDPELNPKGFAREIKTGLTEWAIHWDTPKTRHTTDMVGVLWSAEVVAEMVQTGLDFDHYFCLNQYGGHALFNKLNVPRPLYYFFTMYAENAGRRSLEATCDDDAVWVNATRRDDGDVTVFIINRKPDARARATITLSDITGVKTVRAYTVADGMKYVETDPALIEHEGRTVGLTVVPFSVTAVRITPVSIEIPEAGIEID
jgi:hypothetical protein